MRIVDLLTKTSVMNRDNFHNFEKQSYIITFTYIFVYRKKTYTQQYFADVQIGFPH